MLKERRCFKYNLWQNVLEKKIDIFIFPRDIFKIFGKPKAHHKWAILISQLPPQHFVWVSVLVSWVGRWDVFHVLTTPDYISELSVEF